MFCGHSGAGDKIMNRDMYTTTAIMKHSLLRIFTGHGDSSSAFPQVCLPSWIVCLSTWNSYKYLLCGPSSVVFASWKTSIKIEFATYFQMVYQRKKEKKANMAKC